MKRFWFICRSGVLGLSVAWLTGIHPCGADLRAAAPEPGHPILQAPPIQAAELRARAKAEKACSTDKLLCFAETYEAAARHTAFGQWETLEGGRARWTLFVHAPGATNVNLGLADVALPASGVLRISTGDGCAVAGPYHEGDLAADGQLWTPVLPGDFIVVEAEMPEEARADFSLTISCVNSGFLDVAGRPEAAATEAEKQGWCNIDVACPLAAAWQDPVRSVGRCTVLGRYLCTGTLVMNQRADFRPFFLTANHCVSSIYAARSVVVYWNYQSPTCGALGGGSLGQYQSGASLRATHALSDFTLLELDTQPSSAAGVHYAGWDCSGGAVAGAAGIHHPWGDEKAWCYENHALQSTDFASSTVDSGASHWRVPHWEYGTTEDGSSGSGLWEGTTQRIVGQLHGGYSACGNNLSDWYGKLSASWQGGGTSSSRLRDWLDPDNTGLLYMDGRDPAAGSTWDAGYQSLGDGWRRLAWFGDYIPMGGDGWIWHNRHGFLFVPADAASGSIWLFAQDMGWLWTGNTTYPFLYRSSDGAWVWYNGATGPRWFRNMATGVWETW